MKLNLLLILLGAWLVVGVDVARAYAEDAEAIPGEYLVKFKASSGGASIASSKIQGKASMKASFSGVGIFQIQMKSGEQQKANIEELRNDPDVEFFEPNYVLRRAENGEPSQEALSYERFVATGVSTSAGIYSQSTADTGIAQSWSTVSPLSGEGDKITVAVIDSGLDAYHEVFLPYGYGGSGALWVNQAELRGRAGVDDDQNGFVDDINGWNFILNNNNFADDDNHGTHVAGIVVGAGQNIFARPLEESKVKVMPLKFLDASGKGTTANAIRAIYYAVNNGARIINNSWGGYAYSRALHEAIIYAYDSRVLVVSAAGNYAKNNDREPMFPSSLDVPSNISIASTSSYDRLSGFSNYGSYSVELGSPGEWIASTAPGNKSMYMSGTSMAAPFVAGVAALALREAPSLSGYQLKQLLVGTARQTPDLNGKVQSSSRIDAYETITKAQRMVTVSSTQPAYKPSFLADRSPAAEGAGGCGLVKAVTKNGPGNGDGATSAEGMMVGVMLALLAAPVVVVRVLRARSPQSRRRHERFKMNSEIRVSVGDRELVGAVNTISEGGLSFNATEALEKGGIVTMRIQSPDGHETIEVQGQVVWSEANKAYGVQFENARQGTLAMIRDWTAGLMKT